MKPASVADYREAARRRLPRVLFDYIDGGSYAEETLAANVGDIGRLKLRQRVMRDVSKLSTADHSCSASTLSMPVVLSPVGLAGMYARRGEAQAARAAEGGRGAVHALDGRRLRPPPRWQPRPGRRHGSSST